MSFADRVLAGLGRGIASRAGPLLPAFVRGLTDQTVATDELVTVTDPTEAIGHAGVFDLDASPFATYLGQLSGTEVPGGLTLAQQRDYVRDAPGRRRGTPAAMVAALRPFLTGYKRVDIIERDGSPWRLRVLVYTAQIAPGVTQAQLEAAAALQKPVGNVMVVEQRAGASFDHNRTHTTTFDSRLAYFPTFNDATNHLPEEGTIA
ncbi:MAG: hypothetical protein F2667_00330 [Actinobacteria bacterium]|nr:hypothetical protein [Actinomycetota bacterium]